VAGDTIVWPVGLGREPQLLALRLGATGEVALPAARRQGTPTPTASPSPTPTATPAE
jgi:hypothetical protein